MQISSSMFGSMFPTRSASTTSNAGLDMSWADTTSLEGRGTAVRTAFDDYQKKTPAEKMKAAMLQRLGVTEEEYKAMTPEERAKIDEKIQAMIKEEVEQKALRGEEKKGVFADLKV